MTKPRVHVPSLIIAAAIILGMIGSGVGLLALARRFPVFGVVLFSITAITVLVVLVVCTLGLYEKLEEYRHRSSRHDTRPPEASDPGGL